MSIIITWSSDNYVTVSQTATDISQETSQAQGAIQGINSESLNESSVVVNIDSTQVTNSDGSVTLFEQYHVSFYTSGSATVGNIRMTVSYVQEPSSDSNFTTIPYVTSQSVTATGCFANYNTGAGIIQYLPSTTSNNFDRKMTIYQP